MPIRALALLLALGVVGACGADTEKVGDPIAGKSIKAIPSGLLPPEVSGLKVTTEDVKDQLTGVKRSFVDRIGLFGLRRGDLLVSTLQVSRFNDSARVSDRSFQSSLLARIGASVPKLYILGGKRVFLTSGNKQTVAVWFRRRTMYVLSVRQDYETPRGLVRQILDLTQANDEATA